MENEKYREEVVIPKKSHATGRIYSSEVVLSKKFAAKRNTYFKQRFFSTCRVVIGDFSRFFGSVTCGSNSEFGSNILIKKGGTIGGHTTIGNNLIATSATFNTDSKYGSDCYFGGCKFVGSHTFGKNAEFSNCDLEESLFHGPVKFENCYIDIRKLKFNTNDMNEIKFYGCSIKGIGWVVNLRENKPIVRLGGLSKLGEIYIYPTSSRESILCVSDCSYFMDGEFFLNIHNLFAEDNHFMIRKILQEVREYLC